MRQQADRPTINISAIPVSGVGGLGLVAMAVIVAMALPEVQWFLLSAVTLGLLLAVVLIARHRPQTPGGPSGSVHRVLLGDARGPAQGLSPAAPPRDAYDDANWRRAAVPVIANVT